MTPRDPGPLHGGPEPEPDDDADDRPLRGTVERAPFDPRADYGMRPQRPHVRPVPGQQPLRVVGGAEAPPRAAVTAFVRQCHKGQRNRHTGEIEPWSTLVLVHLDSRQPVGQWDVRPDEDDLELACLINTAADAHGVPLARLRGTQIYQLDGYFGGTVTPRAHQIVEVDAPADALMGSAQSALLNRGQLGNAAVAAQRGGAQMTPGEHQSYRHNEALMAMSFGAVQWNQQNMMDQIVDLRAEVQYYRDQIGAIEEREQKLKDAEHKYKLDLLREQRSAARKDWIVAKLSNYAPVFLAKLDQRISGAMALSTDEKEAKALGVIKTLLSKMNDTNGGPEKLAAVAETLGLSDADLEPLMDIGKILWLEDQRAALHRQADAMSRGGGFASLGADVKAIADRFTGPKPDPNDPKKG